MIDRIGAQWGFEKRTSDAPGEWWHLRWREGSWKGTDPGPHGAPPAPAPVPVGSDRATGMRYYESNMAPKGFHS